MDIRIGAYSIFDKNGSEIKPGYIWIFHTSGEGGAFDQNKLEQALGIRIDDLERRIKNFYKENF